MNKISNNHGFTLAELIISVGTLALIGIITIQLFMSAKDIGRRTEELDHSVYLSNYIVESIKAGMWEKTPLSEMEKESQEAEAGRIFMKTFYDRDWETVEGGSQTALFEVALELGGQANTLGDRTLYDISLRIRRLKPYFRGKVLQPVLYSLNTKIYTETPEEAKLP